MQTVLHIYKQIKLCLNGRKNSFIQVCFTHLFCIASSCAITAEMVDAMIVSMKMNKDSSLSIEFNHMDEFKAIYDTIDILRKEVA